MTTPRPAWPFDRASALTPPAEFAQIRQTCPFSEVETWNGEPAWIATRWEDVRTVLADHRFSSNPATPGVMPAPSEAALTFWQNKGTFDKLDPPEHDHERKMVTPEFTVRNVEQYRDAVIEIVDQLLDEMQARGGVVDLVQAFGNPLPAQITCVMMGLPTSDAPFFRRQLLTFMSQASSQDESKAAMQALLDYFDRVVADRIDQPTDDVAGRLVTHHVVNGELTREGARRMLLDLLIGGLDTTSSMIALGTVTLLEHPDQLHLLRENPAQWNQAVEELLRYLTIAQFIGSRTATDDVEIGTTTVRRGDGVIASLLAANWDPERFERPDQFDVTRDARGHVAFGFGVHQCIGQPLARLELQIAMPRLFERFPHLTLVTTSRDLEFNRTTIHTAKEVLVDLGEPA